MFTAYKNMLATYETKEVISKQRGKQKEPHPPRYHRGGRIMGARPRSNQIDFGEVDKDKAEIVQGLR